MFQIKVEDAVALPVRMMEKGFCYRIQHLGRCNSIIRRKVVPSIFAIVEVDGVKFCTYMPKRYNLLHVNQFNILNDMSEEKHTIWNCHYLSLIVHVCQEKTAPVMKKIILINNSP